MKINMNNESLRIAKEELRKAEKNYVQLLEKTIKEQLDPSNLVDEDEFKRFLLRKTSAVCDYVMDMGVWAIQEQFLEDHHYLEKYLELSNLPANHHSEYEGCDEEFELEILQEIHANELLSINN